LNENFIQIEINENYLNYLNFLNNFLEIKINLLENKNKNFSFSNEIFALKFFLWSSVEKQSPQKASLQDSTAMLGSEFWAKIISLKFLLLTVKLC